MSLGRSDWKGRRKSARRRLANDLRNASPLIAIAFCLASSATAIVAVESAVSSTVSLGADGGAALDSAPDAAHGRGCSAVVGGLLEFGR